MLKPEWSDYEMPLESILSQPWGLAVKHGREGLRRVHVRRPITDWHKTGFIEQLEKKWGIKPTKFAQDMHAKYK